MREGDLLGRAEVTVPEIMGARNWTVTKPLSAQIKNKNYGTVTIMGLRVVVRAAMRSCESAKPDPARPTGRSASGRPAGLRARRHRPCRQRPLRVRALDRSLLLLMPAPSPRKRQKMRRGIEAARHRGGRIQAGRR